MVLLHCGTLSLLLTLYSATVDDDDDDDVVVVVSQSYNVLTVGWMVSCVDVGYCRYYFRTLL